MTNTEKALVELSITVAGLEVRLDMLSKTADTVNDIDRRLTMLEQNVRLAVLEENVKELKKIAEEKDRRRWTVVLAAIGCLLTLAANIGLTYFRLNK